MKSPFYVDNSALASFAKCRTKGLVRYAMGYTSREDSAASSAGRACHKAIETALKGGSLDSAMAAFDAQYEPYWEANKAFIPDRLTFENVRRIIEYWLEANPVRDLPYDVNPQMVEVKFAVPLDDRGELILCGTMDGVATHRQLGTRSPLDHKTTGNVTQNWVRGYQNDSQMSGYIYALGYLTGEPVDSAFINVIEVRKLPGSDRKCKTHGLPYSECAPAHLKYMQFMTDRTPTQLGMWRQTAIRLATEMREQYEQFGTFAEIQGAGTEGMFTGACTFCELSGWCISGRQEKRAKAELVHDPWIDVQKGFPEEGAPAEAA